MTAVYKRSVKVTSRGSAQGRAQPLTSGARRTIKPGSAERLVAEVQRSFAPSILEEQVPSSTDIQEAKVTVSSQPRTDFAEPRGSSAAIGDIRCGILYDCLGMTAVLTRPEYFFGQKVASVCRTHTYVFESLAD